MILVRSINLDRKRSGIVDLANALTSAWRICFELKPRPSRLWDDYFDKLVFDCRSSGRLRYDYLLTRRPHADSYRYRTRGSRVWHFLVDGLLRRRRVLVAVVCEPGAEHLNAATHELHELVSQTNRMYSTARQWHRDAYVAEEIAEQRLDRALRDFGRGRQTVKAEARREPELLPFTPAERAG
jgi:hypothetical protein